MIPVSKVERPCGHCGSLFTVDASRLQYGRGKHCSPACQYAAKRALPKTAIRKICLSCGSGFSISRSRLAIGKGAGKYCSRKCRDVHWRGAATPNWQGIRQPHRHGPTWYSARRRALGRDNRTCQDCGATDHLHVHHIIPGRLFSCTEYANDLDNLITLCESCHRREEAKAWWQTIGGGIGDPEGGALQFTPNGVAWKMAKRAGLL